MAPATISTGCGCRRALSVDEAGEPAAVRHTVAITGTEVIGRHAVPCHLSDIPPMT
jgi:hypothetical protein